MSYERYGNDAILKDGDIIASANGDIFTAKDYEAKNQESAKFEGYYNILFSLTDRLLTIKGDNPLQPEYGSGVIDLLSSPNTKDLAERLKNEIRESLESDDRVQNVGSITVEQKGSQISVKAELVIVGTEQVSEFVFPNFVTG